MRSGPVPALGLALILSMPLLLTGCPLLEGLNLGFNSRGRRPVLPAVTPLLNQVMYLGEHVSFEVHPDPSFKGPLRLEILNEDSGERRPFEILASELAAFTIPLEATTLPGFSEQGLNRYQLSITGERFSTQGGFWVVADRRIPQPPSYPMGKFKPVGSEPSNLTVDGLEAFAREVVAAWKGSGITVVRRELPADERPSNPRLEVMDPDAPIWEFTATGEFPRYALPARDSSTGTDTLMTPKQLKIQLSLSEPLMVLSVKAFE